MRSDPLLEALLRHHPEKAPPHLLKRRCSSPPAMPASGDSPRASQPAFSARRAAAADASPQSDSRHALHLSFSFSLPLRPWLPSPGAGAAQPTRAPAPMPSSVLAIIKEVSRRSGIQVSRLRGPERAKDVCLARHYIMWRARREAGLSLPRIALVLGRRDHTSALHAVRKIEAMHRTGELQPALNRLFGQQPCGASW